MMLGIGPVSGYQHLGHQWQALRLAASCVLQSIAAFEQLCAEAPTSCCMRDALRRGGWSKLLS